MIKAILFDLDGVLVETEWETFQFYRLYLLRHHNIRLRQGDFKYKAGRKSVDFWNDVLTAEQQAVIDTEKLTRHKRELFNRYPSRYVTRVPGVHRILSALCQHGFLLALVTQNEKPMVNTVMRWLKLVPYFTVKLSLNDIRHKKPHPEIYLLAAKRLGVKPNECLVIEDSRDGVASAKNALMLCVGIKHTYTPRRDLALADVRISKLTNLTPAFIKKLEKRKSR